MPNHKTNILVIDDDAGDVELFRRSLASIPTLTFELRHLDSPKTACDAITQHSPDIIFIDYHLGATTGVDVLKAIRESGSVLPIVILTGQGNESIATKSLQAGADDYVCKADFSPDTLRRTIQYALGQHDRRQAEAEIERLARFPSEYPDPILRVSNQGLILYANQTAEHLLRDWGVFRGDRLPDEMCRVTEDAIRSGHRHTLEMTCDDRHYDMVFAAVREANYVNLYGRDVTQQKVAEANLREKEEQFRHAQKLEAVGVLAGGVAHEFNNLLQAIRGYAGFAMDELPADSQPCQDLEQVLIATDRAAALTSQLLGFGRRQSLTLTDLHPNELVDDLVKMLRPLIGEQITIETKLANDVASVHGDATLLQQMLMNLCVNARDAMPDGGTLVIGTEDTVLTDLTCEMHVDAKPGRYAGFYVSDNGCGISAALRSKIFEPFFTSKEIGKGTGLGLSMVHGVVQQHEGVLHVSSDPGLGTTFKIYLPVADATAPSNPASQEELPVHGGCETVLLAEDELLVRNLAIRVLSEAGYRVLAAADGEEAVNVFSAHADDISLAILDVVMPKMNGRLVYQAIKSMKPEVSAVFCSGYDAETNGGGDVTNHKVQLIQKPFDSNELLSTVRKVLDGEAPCRQMQATCGVEL